jgi:hypothetical protein
MQQRECMCGRFTCGRPAQEQVGNRGQLEKRPRWTTWVLPTRGEQARQTLGWRQSIDCRHGPPLQLDESGQGQLTVDLGQWHSETLAVSHRAVKPEFEPPCAIWS